MRLPLFVFLSRFPKTSLEMRREVFFFRFDCRTASGTVVFSTIAMWNENAPVLVT